MVTKIKVNIGSGNGLVLSGINVDLSPKMFIGIHLRAISLEVLKNL